MAVETAGMVRRILAAAALVATLAAVVRGQTIAPEALAVAVAVVQEVRAGMTP
jgi:hypothetical protein